MNKFGQSLLKSLAAVSATLSLAAGFGLAPALAKNGTVGWQNAFAYTVPTGLTHGFFSYTCPGSLIARSGGFFPNPALQQLGINLGVSGPRYDINNTSGYQIWGFEYNIPGGAPAGQTIQFNVNCQAPPI